MNRQFSNHSDYKHVFEVQVRFHDLDSNGHVNHANYLSYVEQARLNYFDCVLGKNTDWHKQQSLVMAHAELHYQDAIDYDDQVKIYTRCLKIGSKSFLLTWTMTTIRGKNESVVATGKNTLVCFNYLRMASMKIPPDKKIRLQQFDAVP